MGGKVTVAALQRMKAEGRKIVAVVVYDYPMACIADRAGVDIVSVGDSVGRHMWGQASDLAVTVDEMIFACRAVRRGVRRALLSCDMPFGPLQEGVSAAVRAAVRLVKEGGAEMVKLDGAADFPEAVAALARAGIPVWAQFGRTPQTALRCGGVEGPGPDPGAHKERLLEEARRLEQAGASLLDFTHSGPEAGALVARSVGIPVIGGLGGGPWLDGRVRSVGRAVGYDAAALDDGVERYANVARICFDALTAYAVDVRAGRRVKGE